MYIHTHFLSLRGTRCYLTHETKEESKPRVTKINLKLIWKNHRYREGKRYKPCNRTSRKGRTGEPLQPSCYLLWGERGQSRVQTEPCYTLIHTYRTHMYGGKKWEMQNCHTVQKLGSFSVWQQHLSGEIILPEQVPHAVYGWLAEKGLQHLRRQTFQFL